MEQSPKAISAAPATGDALAVLVARAAKGDATAVPALRHALRDPSVVEALGGNLAKCAQHSFVKPLCGDDLAVREAIYAKMDALRAELIGSNPTPIVRLLVERVVACWLQVQDADIRYAQNQKEMTVRQGDFAQRRIDAANRRYLTLWLAGVHPEGGRMGRYFYVAVFFAAAALFAMTIAIINTLGPDSSRSEGSSSTKHDPIEDDPTMKAVFDAAERDTELAIANDPPERKRQRGYCHRFWAVKKSILREKYGIEWRTPAEMNPKVAFDY